MCACAETSAAAAHVADGSPNVIACSSGVCDLVTMHSAYRRPGTIDAASSMSALTGVTPRVPMIDALVSRAPSQCERSISSRLDTPGNRYLFPPEKPTTSCGNTGLTMTVTSCSTTALLMLTWPACVSMPPDSWAIRLALMVPMSANADGSHQAWLSTVIDG